MTHRFEIPFSLVVPESTITYDFQSICQIEAVYGNAELWGTVVGWLDGSVSPKT